MNLSPYFAGRGHTCFFVLVVGAIIAFGALRAVGDPATTNVLNAQAPAATNAAPASSAPPAKTEDWTVGGKTFHNVTVTKVEADLVHILYDGGAGSVPLASLTPDLQKKFGYNPVAAAQAAQQRQQQEAATDAMVQAVNAQQAKQAQAQQIATVSKTNAQRQAVQAQINACLVAIKSDQDEVKAESWKYGNSAKWQAQLSTDQARLTSLQQSLSTLPQ